MEIGAMVEVDESAVLRLLNINVMGMFRVNRTFLPMIMKGRGRIINVSSENGWESGGPFNGTYSMSKHAVEAYTDSLRRELMLLGIKVIKIQPGPFRTNMVTTTKRLFIEATEKSTHFQSQLRTITNMMDKEWEKANSPEIMARVTYRAMTTPRPRTAYSVRPDPQRSFLDLLPASLADRLIASILK
jgi:NAD(P)-dependent dehydrogenase (short-subunit alcohol dehydrogenase family)